LLGEIGFCNALFQFASKKAAKTFAQLKNNERLIGETEGAKQLAKFGKIIADAIAFYLPHLQASKQICTFAERIAELIPAKAPIAMKGTSLASAGSNSRAVSAIGQNSNRPFCR
jgi:hypothetical protein